MAIRHRTKEQKRTAAARRLTYSLPSLTSFDTISSPTTASPERQNSALGKSTLYDYHPNLIKKDLFKTLLVSLIVLMVELGLYYYL